jgi:hypothetical protein
MEGKRSKLIEQLKARLRQPDEDCTLFTVEWELM